MIMPNKRKTLTNITLVSVAAFERVENYALNKIKLEKSEKAQSSITHN